MLQDPRWNSEPSLAGYALFVASKEPGETYVWTDCEKCPVGQYLASIGRHIPLAQWDGDLAIANTLARGGGLNGGVHALMDWTFGGLADRILAHQMKETVPV
jgi:hypothetical protein